MEKGINIAAVGDICLGEHPFCAGYGVKTTISNNPPSYLFDNIKEVLAPADIIFGNLEGALSNAGLVENNISSVAFRGQPEAVNVLTDSGFNILNIANNHIMQHGNAAFMDTKRLLEQHRISALGCTGNAAMPPYSLPVIKSIRGIDIGFLGYSFIKEAYYDGAPLYAVGAMEKIRADMAHLKEKVDILVVSCHWSEEVIDRPSTSVIHAAREIIDGGAHIVLGHHSHVFQGVEKYKHGIIFYSLGNCIFDLMWEKQCLQSAIAVINITRSKKIDFHLVPFIVPKRYKLDLLTGRSKKKFLDHVQEISKKITTSDTTHSDTYDMKYDKEVEFLHSIGLFKKAIFILCNFYRTDLRFFAQFLKYKFTRVP